jgi:hypothetical protein
MKFRALSIIMIAILGFALGGNGQKYYQVQERPEQDFLGEGLDWMIIPSTEHTAEYLAKVGGIQGDPTAVSGQNVKGNWTLELRDLRGRIVGKFNLEMYQVGTIVYGLGSTSDGLVATANGAIFEDTMNLGVVTAPRVALYRLKLRPSDISSGGTFDAYSPVGYMNGDVYASKEVPRILS